MKTIFLLFLAGAIVAAETKANSKQAGDESGKKRLSKSQLEAIDLVENGKAAIDGIRSSIKNIARKRESVCLKAFGSEKFCSCLGENLPVVVDSPKYVNIMISTKEELGYQKAGAEDKKVIDLALAARESCVSDGF